MNLKYTTNLTKESADIYLYGLIGDKIDGDSVAAEIRYLDSQGIKIINEYINSEGGEVINGLSIIAANIRAGADIHTFDDGVAASMAGIIYLSGKKKYMLDYSRLMLHEPSFNDETIETAEEPLRTAMISFRDQLVELIMKSTNKSAEDVKKLLKEETWYDAFEAQKMGFVDKILKTDFSKQLKNLTPSEIYAKIAAQYEIKNELIKIKMEKVAKLLNVQDVEDEITARIQALLDELETAKAEIETIKASLAEKETVNATLVTEKGTLQSQTDALNAKITEFEELRKTDMIENAFESGKITASQKIVFAKMKIADLKDVLDTMPVAPPSIMDILRQKQNSPDNYKSLKDEWDARFKDGSLAKVKIENLDHFKEIYKAKFGKEYK
jgi:ATP-dependent Clp protease protease subunit